MPRYRLIYDLLTSPAASVRAPRSLPVPYNLAATAVTLVETTSLNAAVAVADPDRRLIAVEEISGPLTLTGLTDEALSNVLEDLEIGYLDLDPAEISLNDWINEDPERLFPLIDQLQPFIPGLSISLYDTTGVMLEIYDTTRQQYHCVNADSSDLTPTDEIAPGMPSLVALVRSILERIEPLL